MEKIKKIKFSDIVGMLEKDEMKEILGGSNGITYSCGAGPYSQGMLSPSIPMSNSPSNGWGGGKAIGSTFGGIPYNSGSSNYGGNSSGTSSSGSGNSYSTNTYGSNSYNVGWNNSDSGMTTNDPFAINRFFNFLISNNGVLSSSQVDRFMDSEAVHVPKGAIPLNNVTVPNYYKGPSTIPKGVVYDNGVLHINSTNSGQGGATNGTLGVLVPFTKTQVTDGLNKVKFSEMALKSITDWDPVKKDFNFSNTFQPIMKLNAEGAYSIALYENLSLTTYDRDGNKAKHTTVGFGHKLHDGAMKSTDPKSITFDQAVTFLAQDIISAENALNQKIENFDLTGKFNRNQYSALVDMTYNAGPGSKDKPTIVSQVLEAMKSGGVDAANKIMENSYLDKTIGGVQDRRYFEAQAFIHGRLLTPEQAKAELTKQGLK